MNEITKQQVEKYFYIDGLSIINGIINADSARMIKSIRKIPFQFGKITDEFECRNSSLVTLNGCPDHVGGDFDCSQNKLSDLIGGPTFVGGDFSCNVNYLKSFKGLPDSVGGIFYCDINKKLPILLLLKYEKVDIGIYSDYDEQANEIIQKYCGQKPLRQAIIKCQKELIDSGFKGNAKL